MRSTARPLLRLLVVALGAMGAAGSQALRGDLAAAASTDSIAPPAIQCPADGLGQLAGPDAPGAGDLDDALPGLGPGPGPDSEPIRRVCRVTAYHDRGLTSAGVPSGIGQCAAPADVPIGSRIHIPALGRTFVVTDRTHRRFRNSTVDIFVPCPDRCRKFGCRYLEVEITLPERPHSHPELLQAARRLARTG